MFFLRNCCTTLDRNDWRLGNDPLVLKARDLQYGSCSKSADGEKGQEDETPKTPFLSPIDCSQLQNEKKGKWIPNGQVYVHFKWNHVSRLLFSATCITTRQKRGLPLLQS